jgi:hypothetical protein
MAKFKVCMDNELPVTVEADDFYTSVTINYSAAQFFNVTDDFNNQNVAFYKDVVSVTTLPEETTIV